MFALIVVLGGMSLASVPASDDFAPFTMRVTWYTANAIVRSSGSVEAGTAVSLLNYESINTWKTTVLSSSWDPSAVGSTNGVDGRTHKQFTFVAQARKFAQRVIPSGESAMIPERWLDPGLINHIEQQGFTRIGNSRAGTVTFIESSAKSQRNADGTVAMHDGTIAVFDSRSTLPLSVKTYQNGKLRESRQYEVVSQP
jgi:hypothetical protein